MPSGSPELRIAVAAYEAVTDPSKWKQVLSEIAQHCGADKAALFTPVEGATERFLWSDIGLDPQLLSEYSGHWVNQDPWVEANIEQHLYVVGNVQIGSAYFPWDQLERTAFYNEFAVPIGVKGLISTILFDDRDAAIAPRTHLSLFREPGQPEFEFEQARFLRRVQPHLRRAAEMYWAMVKARALPQAVKETLDGLPEPVLVLRADGGIEHANPAADALLAEVGLLTVRRGRLTAIAGESRSWLEALHRAGLGVGSVLSVTHQRGRHVFSGVLRLAPVLTNPSYLTVWPDAVGVVVIELRGLTEQASALTSIISRYLLTPKEVQVLQLLADGHAPGVIADRLQVRLSTVRTHLHNLYEKTGLHRQGDLIRLLAR